MIKSLLRGALWTVCGLFATLCALAAYGASLSDPPPSSDLSIPFELHEGHIVVTAMLNGKPVRAVLDTGAPVSVLDTAYAKREGLPLKKTRGSINDQAMHSLPGSAYELTLGGQKITPLYATDLSVIEKVPLVLSASDASSGRVLEVDFHKRIIVLHRRETFVPPADAKKIDLVARPLLFRHYAMPVSINGTPLLAEIDLGSNGGVSLSSAAAQKAGLTLIPEAGFRSTMVNRPNAERDTAHGDVEIGGYNYPSRLIEVSRPDDTFAFEHFEGNLGVLALQSFHLWLDLSRKRMWLIRPPYYAIGMDAPGGEVKGVRPGRPAEKAGIKIGDRIVTVNGQPAQTFFDTRDTSSPAPYVMTLSDGRSLTVHPIEVTE